MAYVPVPVPLVWGDKPSVTFDEYKEKFDYYMGYKAAPKEPPPLVIPSNFWECTGVYTVYVLGCYLIYLLTAG